MTHAAAEAAVWVARLHRPSRSSELEAEFRAWLDVSDDHRRAFERCTEIWQEVPRITVADAYQPVPRRPSRRRWAAAALAGLAAAWIALRPVGETYDTGIGEYRQVVLADGSRLRLNTATQLRVTLTMDRRDVDLAAGEALFEVARDPARPFVVRAGSHEVRALGTEFAVRLKADDPEALSVTLIEGKVVVTAQTSRATQASSAATLVLEPGQRLQTAAGAAFRLDRPPIDRASAWTREQTVFDDVTLPEAVTEMNRYSRQPIELAADARLRDLRISGVYRAGDSESFARTVAFLHGLEVVAAGPGWAIRAGKTLR